MNKVKAFVSGIEVTVLNFYKENGFDWCQVYVPSIGIKSDYLTSWVEVRYAED